MLTSITMAMCSKVHNCWGSKFSSTCGCKSVHGY